MKMTCLAVAAIGFAVIGGVTSAEARPNRGWDAPAWGWDAPAWGFEGSGERRATRSGARSRDARRGSRSARRGSRGYRSASSRRSRSGYRQASRSRSRGYQRSARSSGSYGYRTADWGGGDWGWGGGGGGRSVGARPGRWCGWWMRTQRGGGPEYNLARNWRNYGRASGPQVGAVVVWPGHVGQIVGRASNGQWIVQSGNDGGAVRTRPRSVAGAVFRMG